MITCQPIMIRTSADIVVVKPIRVNYVVNSSVTLSCKPGYNGTIVHSLCKANGKWSVEQPPICTRKYGIENYRMRLCL